MSYRLHLCQCGRTYTYECPVCHVRCTAPNYAPIGDDGRYVPVKANPLNLLLWREERELEHLHLSVDVASGVMV